MAHTKKCGDWLFEIKSVRAIKVDKFGDPYSATCQIRIVNGRVEVEGLISQHKLTKSDFMAIREYIKSLGFDGLTFQRHNGGRCETIDKVI